MIILNLFTSTGCPYCELFKEELVKLDKDFYNLRVFNVSESDEDVELANKFEIQEVPTLIIMNGGKEIGRFNKSIDASELKNKITSL